MGKEKTNKNGKGFMLYENNYLLIKILPKNEQEKLALAIMDYMFNDNAVIKFENKDSYAVWLNIKMVLDKSKLQSKRVSKRWNLNTKEDTEINTNVDTKTDTIEHTKLDTKVDTIYFLVSNFIFLKDRGLLRGKIEEWIKYKQERKEYYKETGFKSLLTQIENNVKKYGEDEVIDLITECMANNYKGIIFEKLKKSQKKVIEKKPSWFDENIKSNLATEEEQREFEMKLKNMKEGIKNGK